MFCFLLYYTGVSYSIAINGDIATTRSHLSITDMVDTGTSYIISTATVQTERYTTLISNDGKSCTYVYGML